MAEKTVNVKIQYNVDSTQVQAAEARLRQANAASNQFQQAAQKAGQGTSQAFSQANRSILSMEMELARLKTQISVASNPAAVKRLSDQYKDLKLRLDEATKSAYQLPKALNETGKSTQSLTSQFGQLYTAAKLFLTAGIIRETVSMTLEMAKLSGNVDGVSKAFERTFPNSLAMLQQLRESTHGTIDDFSLMQRALKAQNLGVPIENLGMLLEFAATRAQQTGDSVDYLVNSIIDGLGRKSILKLDNLGVSATRLKEAMGGISTQAATVAQVTEAFSKVAGEELQKMGGYAETSATKVDQLTVAMQELRIEASQKLETSGFIQFLTEGVNYMKLFLKGNNEIIKDQAKLAAAQEAERIMQGNAFKELGNNQQAKLDFIQQEINSRQQLIGRYNDEIKKLNELVDAGRGLGTGSFSANTEGVKLLIKYQEQYGNKAREVFQKDVDYAKKSLEARKLNKLEIQETIKVLGEYLAEIEKISSQTIDQPGLIEDLQDKIENLKESLVKAKTEDEIAKINRELLVLEARLKELQSLGKSQNSPFASYIADMKLFKVQLEGFRITAKDLLPDSQDIQRETDKTFKSFTDKIKGDMKSQMGDVGRESAESFVDHFKIYLESRESDFAVEAIDIFSEQLISIEFAEVASLQNRLNNLRNFYDEQMILAGDNEREKQDLRLKEERESAKLQKRIAERERNARRFSVIIDTAAGIAKAFATSTTIYEGIINAAIVAARGASQLAIVNRTPARFAKGGLNIQGPGTGTSDSIPAQISKGESVMTAQEWKTSKNVLKEVRAKTLDDKVLSDLKLTRDGVRYVGMDDKNIVKEIRDLKNSFPDVEERAGIVYRTRRKTETYKQWVRLSSLSK